MNGPESFAELNRRSRAQRVHKGWLTKRITLEEAEAKNLVDFSDSSAARLELARSRGIRLTGSPVPFGFMNLEWSELVASMREGEELWEFSSAEHAWQNLAGRAGIALVRNDEIVDCILTAMS
jgi:hypothetical protein